MTEYINNRVCGSLIICAAFVMIVFLTLDARFTTRKLGNRPPQILPRLMFPESGLDHHISRSVTCNDTRLMARGTFPLIALASFPGSGNTWVRHLIESATGIATGSYYNSPILRRHGFIGEARRYDSGETLTIKMHFYMENLNGAILLLRNPYKALVADGNRRKGGKTGFAKKEIIKNFDFVRLLRMPPIRWLELVTKYIKTYKYTDSSRLDEKSLLIVYYENLVDNLDFEIRRILTFLDVQLDEDRLNCTLRNAEGMFHRKHTFAISDPFTPEQRLEINKELNAFHNLLDETGLPKPPKSFEHYPTTF